MVKEKDVNVSLYPAAKVDSTFNFREANKLMYLFMEEKIYASLYKIMREDDVPRLQAAMEKCQQLPEQEEVDECVHLLNAQGVYEKFLITLQKCCEEDRFYIELQSTSVNEKKLDALENKLQLCKVYLTMGGKAQLLYRSAQKELLLCWTAYEQTVDLYRMSLDNWKNQMIQKEYVTGKDVMIFESLCEAIEKAENDRTFVFAGKILSAGTAMDGYKVRIQPVKYGQEDVVVGSWTIMNGKSGDSVDDYLEGTFIDSLTAILNKRAITEYAQKAVQPGKQVAIAVLDIDYFKNVNDTYGHLFGDQVIAAVADVIKRAVGDAGMIGRIGGDEFLIVLENYMDLSGLRSYLRTIKNEIAMLFLDRVGDNRLSCSIGVSQCGIDGEDYDTLFRTADKALYIAKQKGRSRFIIYNVEKHGRLSAADDVLEMDMKEIRGNYYSEQELSAMNRMFTEFILKGREVLPDLLEQAVKTLMTDRIQVFWKTDKEVLAAYPFSILWEEKTTGLLENQSYMDMFENDLLMITNTNYLEYPYPEIFAALKEHNVLSIMQYRLRDREGKVCGLVSLEECTSMVHFPRVAVQLFEGMASIINAVLIQDLALDK